ncbi:MAG: hypothetical protein U1F51_11365 [Burkholderiales bacterium]
MTIRISAIVIVAATSAALSFAPNASAQTGPAQGGGNRHCGGNGKCKVAIDVARGAPCTAQDNIQVSPETIEMGRGERRTIVWKLETPGYEFCPANGDGIQFKDANLDFQFHDPKATDDDDGEDDAGAPARCRKSFRWRNKNEEHTAGRRYAYLIRFTGPNGAVCVKDPWVRNG